MPKPISNNHESPVLGFQLLCGIIYAIRDNLRFILIVTTDDLLGLIFRSPTILTILLIQYNQYTRYISYIFDF